MAPDNSPASRRVAATARELDRARKAFMTTPKSEPGFADRFARFERAIRDHDDARRLARARRDVEAARGAA